MKQKYVLGIVALSMITLLGISMVSAFGFKNRMSNEERETIANAIESGDYETWSSIKRAQISEEKFEELRERRKERAEFRNRIQEARNSGDMETIQQLKEEFGLGKKMRRRNINFGECPFAE